MRRLSLALISTVSALAFTQIASAADLPVKAPPAFMPPPLTWTGFYIGLNAGWGWGNNGGIDNSIVSTFCNTALTGCAPNQWSNALAGAVPGSFDPNLNGFIGGGQFGYNWQTGQVVWGIEADFQGADIKGDATTSNAVSIITVPITTATVVGTGSQKLNFLGTLRGRVGWLATPAALLYVTGGLAYGHTETSVSFTSHFTNCFCGPDPVTSASADEWRAGWTVGGGVEWMFAPNWTIKGEYLYYDLGSQTLNTTLSQNNGAATPFVAVGIASEASYKGNIARVGVNYKF